MKALIVYYSRSGHTAQAADALKRELDAKGVSVEVLRLHRQQEASFLGCAFEARRGAKPALVELPKDVSGYDLLFLGFPTWAGHASSPANSMVEGIQNVSGKKCVLFSMSGLKSGFVKALDDIDSSIKSLGGYVVAKQGFSESERALTAERAAGLVAKVLGHSGS
ncbi:MAG: flavodoxin domain-containing protein [Bacillota bacterium]|nr:flavodoxin domain-containing protein [Bacillota bacterium]